MKLGIIGATGRLGKAIGTLALSDLTFQIAAALTHSHSQHLHLDYGIFLGLSPIGILIEPEPACVPDLLIDVSLSSALSQNISLALALQKPLVIGTTGLSDADFSLLRNASQKIPLLYTANFSLGMALFHKLAREVARHFPSAQIDLIETHHTQKKDAPSGSALSLAKTIQSTARATPRIASIRSGSVIGIHELLFDTPEEKLTLSHHVHSRNAFAMGALAAARFLATQPPGLYGVEDLFGGSGSKAHLPATIAPTTDGAHHNFSATLQ